MHLDEHEHENEPPPHVVRRLLSRREENDGARVVRARVLEHFDAKNGAELLLVVAAIDIPTRNGPRLLPRISLVLHAGEWVQAISIRSAFVLALADALHDAPDAAAELLAACDDDGGEEP